MRLVAAEPGSTCEVDDCGAPATSCDLDALGDGTAASRFFCAGHQPGHRPPFVDVWTITEYGLTQRLSRAIRCF